MECWSSGCSDKADECVTEYRGLFFVLPRPRKRLCQNVILSRRRRICFV